MVVVVYLLSFTAYIVSLFLACFYWCACDRLPACSRVRWSVRSITLQTASVWSVLYTVYPL